MTDGKQKRTSDSGTPADSGRQGLDVQQSVNSVERNETVNVSQTVDSSGTELSTLDREESIPKSRNSELQLSNRSDSEATNSTSSANDDTDVESKTENELQLFKAPVVRAPKLKVDDGGTDGSSVNSSRVYSEHGEKRSRGSLRDVDSDTAASQNKSTAKDDDGKYNADDADLDDGTEWKTKMENRRGNVLARLPDNANIMKDNSTAASADSRLRERVRTRVGVTSEDDSASYTNETLVAARGKNASASGTAGNSSASVDGSKDSTKPGRSESVRETELLYSRATNGNKTVDDAVDEKRKDVTMMKDEERGRDQDMSVGDIGKTRDSGETGAEVVEKKPRVVKDSGRRRSDEARTGTQEEITLDDDDEQRRLQFQVSVMIII